jgi:hypothetical protein
MNTKIKLTILSIIAAGLSIATTTTNLLLPAFAQSATSSNANHFGQGASQMGQSGTMGTHASQQTEPRAGIGNVGNVLCPNSSVKLKPGQTADVLTGGIENCPP